MFQILVVCTANICRSPAAQAILNRALRGRSVQIDSAGTSAGPGNPVDASMGNLMIARGYPEVSAHRSRVLLPHHVVHYQLILCMERHHLEQVCKINPIATGKTMLLGHWNGESEVADPVGQSNETYMNSIDEIHEFCQKWVEKIITAGLVA